MPTLGERDLQMFLMALALGAVEPPPQPMAVEVVRDAITDEIRAFATLREDGNRLVVSCEPSKYDGPRVTIHARRWLARASLFTGSHPGDRHVTYRFDDRPPRRTMWRVRDRHGMLEGHSRANPFLAELVSAERLVVRTRDVENHRYDLTFRLTGVQPAVDQALAACGQARPPASTRQRRVRFRL